jgi:hypothetical protein
VCRPLQTLTCHPPTVLGSALRKREPSAFDEPTDAWISAQLIGLPKFRGRVRNRLDYDNHLGIRD